jgi:transcriptional regulator with XRE-family HTH domain
VTARPVRRYDPSPARARAIRQAREWAQMSLQDLATALGVSKSTVRGWESAVRDPGPEMTARIAVATRSRVSSLLMPSLRRDAGTAVRPASRKAAA